MVKHTAYVALGTNLGDPLENIHLALKLLEERGVRVLQVSTLIETEPYGVTDQPNFLNGVCQVETELSPLELLRLLLKLELDMGRVRLRRWGERIIDMDLLLYEDQVMNTPELTLPHMDMANRYFVLKPLYEIAPRLVHPVLNKTIEQLLRELQKREEIMLDKDRLLKRFISYAEIHTTSQEDSTVQPSAARELDLANYLIKELRELGLERVFCTEHGYVLATLPENGNKEQTEFGLIAHMDTSPEAKGEGVKVQVHKNYSGGDIPLCPGVSIKVSEFPELEQYKGQDIITASGDTLLGADDKAGITAIVSACEYLLEHPEIKHGRVALAFTPDEEIGRGTENFPMGQYDAAYAYTVDGGELGELNYETFNACNVKVTFNGINVHPGTAKNKMRNAITMAAKWEMSLPAQERPEYTEGYEGFYHSCNLRASTAGAELHMILRDHDINILEQRKAFLVELAAKMNEEYGPEAVVLELKDSYYNMRQYIEPVYSIVEKAEEAMKVCGVEPKLIPIRGGTDGSHLSEMGLPCPNIFTGGHNFHGIYEYLPLQSLEKATEVVVELIKGK